MAFSNSGGGTIALGLEDPDKGNKELTAPEVNESSFARGTISAETQWENVDFELLDTDYWRAYTQRRRLTRPIDQAMFHEPSGLLAGKAAIRIFHYRGAKVETDPNTNLLRPPITVGGPAIRQIQKARDVVVNELASGIQMGPLGFEICGSPLSG